MAIKTYTVNYREEFCVTVKANTEEEAIDKAKKISKWTFYNEGHEDYFYAQRE